MAQRKICGIYKIINKINSKFYIGSSNNIKHRWYNHKFDLNNNEHHNTHLQHAWNKYGEDNFEFEIIEECKENERLIREQYYLDKFKCYNDSIGYNISPTVDNTIISKETKDKLSLKSRGENNHFSKLNENEVININNLLLEGYNVTEVSKITNIKRNTIQDIKKGKTWTHVTHRDFKIKDIDILTENNVLEIINMINNGYKIIDISKLLKIKYSKIVDIKRGNTWKEYAHLINKNIG